MRARSPIAMVAVLLFGAAGPVRAWADTAPMWKTAPIGRAATPARGDSYPPTEYLAPGPTTQQTPSCHPLITQSLGLATTAGNSASCTSGPPENFHFDTSYWRAFDMGIYAGGQQYDVSSVEFAIDTARSGSGMGQPVTVRLYANYGGPFPGGTRTEIGAATITVRDTSLDGSKVLLPATVPAGASELVMEVFTPSGQDLGNSFFIGSNAAGQTGPSYASSPNCGNPTPTNTADIGYPNMHILFRVNGRCRTSASADALNISTRLRVGTGDETMIGGFIITGSGPKTVVLRGVGPSLVAAGISDALIDPVLVLRGTNGSTIFQNDNWRDSQERQIQGSIYQPADDRESAMVQTLPAGPYTAILSGRNQTTGVGLVEAYDGGGADSQLANISTRGPVQTGNNVMIAGFVLGGNTGSTHVAIRGIGPSLSQSGLSNVLPDPVLELHNSNGTTLIANDDWQDDPTSAAQLSAQGLALQNNVESGIFTTLPPGAYTAIIAGKNGGTGLGLVEVYNVH